MRKLELHWKIIIGMVLGVIWALLSSTLGWSAFTINWIDPFGTIFINDNIIFSNVTPMIQTI